MSDEQKPKTPAGIERDSANPDQDLNPQEPEIEEIQESGAKPKTAAQIERDRLASLTEKSVPEPESEPASSSRDNLDAAEDEMTAGKIEAALLKKRQEGSRVQAAEDEPKKNKAGWLGIHNLKKNLERASHYRGCIYPYPSAFRCLQFPQYVQGDVRSKGNCRKSRCK